MEPRKAVFGIAAAMLLTFAAAPSHAGPFTVKCTQTAAGSVDLHGTTDTSECFASSDGSGTAKAKAADDDSFADGEIETNGSALATAKGGSFSEATADTGGDSTSHVTGGGDGDATSDENGVAFTKAIHAGEAHSQAFGKCRATARANGAGSLATALCENDGTKACAKATGGGIAKAFDGAPPVCTPGSGTASVRSSGGKCGGPCFFGP